MEINSNEVHTKCILALLSLWILLANAIVTGQHSSYLPESSYGTSSSLSSFRYGNDNQKNYYDNPIDSYSADVSYSNDLYRRQQLQYESNDNDVEDSYDSSPRDYQQPQANYQQDYLTEEVYPFRQNQPQQDSYGRPYPSHQYADLGGQDPSLVSYDNDGSNRSEALTYQAAIDDVKYSPMDSELNSSQLSQQRHKPRPQAHHHNQVPPPSTKQHHLRTAHYTPTNNYMSTSSSMLPYIHTHIDNEKSASSTKESTAHSNMEALMMMLKKSIAASAPLSSAQLPKHAPAKLQSDEPQQDQHQHNIGKESQVEAHYEYPPFDSNTSSLMTKIYPLADDSDHSSAISYSPTAAALPSQSLHIDTNTIALLQKYLVQHPQHVVSSLPHTQHFVPAPYALGDPIPIREHVEITKHVPVPVYKQVHVPYRKPVRIEIPRPVISTIPRPYPIKIPTVTKTVAVPNVREVKIPIEKVVPYPVENRVPYIVQKRVPFEVEKQIAVPKYYPFPVKVPLVRTIMYKKKPVLLHRHHHSSPLDFLQKHHI